MREASHRVNRHENEDISNFEERKDFRRRYGNQLVRGDWVGGASRQKEKTHFAHNRHKGSDETADERERNEASERARDAVPETLLVQGTSLTKRSL